MYGPQTSNDIAKPLVIPVIEYSLLVDLWVMTGRCFNAARII